MVWGVVSWVLAERVSPAYGLSVPTDASSLSAPLRTLVVELVLAAVLASLPLVGLGLRFVRLQNAIFRKCGTWAISILVTMVLIWAVPLAYLGATRPEELSAAFFLLAYLVFWISNFMIGAAGAAETEWDEHETTEGRRSKRNRANVLVIAVIVAGLVSLLCWSEGETRGIWVLCVPLMIVLFRPWWGAMAGVTRDAGRRGGSLSRRRIVPAAAVLATLLVGWIFIDRFDATTGCLVAFVLASAAFLLPVWANRSHPGMIYPASVLFGYATFAILYNTCTEGQQAQLPAAASFMILLSVLVSISLMIRFSQPRRASFTALAFLALILCLNGNAWMVEPNHFKLQFPGLERYYHNAGTPAEKALNPVYLDSRTYFRSTTSSILKLRDEDLVRQEDDRSGQVDAEHRQCELQAAPPNGPEHRLRRLDGHPGPRPTRGRRSGPIDIPGNSPPSGCGG